MEKGWKVHGVGRVRVGKGKGEGGKEKGGRRVQGGIRVRVEKGQGLEWGKGLELKGYGRGKE